MRKRNVVIGSVVVLAALAAVGSTMKPSGPATSPLGSSPTPTAAGLPTSGLVSESPATSSVPPPTAAFAPITLKGTGKKVAKFTIPDGSAAIAVATYGGSSNFAVTSIAADGSSNDLLVNTIGRYKGTVLFDYQSGQHSVAFQVEAAGAWTIVIKPVASARVWDGATTLTGTGDDVVQIVPASSGLVTLDIASKGQGNFAVSAFSPSGSDLLVNEIGKFSGQVLLPDGSFALSVTADGTWSAKPG